MKKKITRIMACFMACLILANTIAVPRAKASAAVVGTSALATSALASYMTATGVPLTVISGGAAAASAGTASLVSGYAAATGATYEVVTTAIAAGTAISGGTIILTAAAVAVLAAIVAWSINEYGVTEDNFTPVYTSSSDGFACFDDSGNAYNFEYSQIVYTSGEPYVIPSSTTQGWGKYLYTQNDSQYRKMITCYNDAGTNQSNGKIYSIEWYDTMTARNLYTLTISGAFYIIRDDIEDQWIFTQLKQDDYGYYRLRSAKYFSFSDYPWIDEFFNCVTSNVSVSTIPEYVPYSLPDNTDLVIHTGVSGIDSVEAVPDAIFESIASNEFVPTYEEQTVSNPDSNPDDGGVTNPDSGEEIGLLRRIAIACEALADKIINGIKSIFAPDAELMQEIADTFTSKFGFVTTLHDLGSDLLSISADSEPPVVYIHLEDAEGTIDYGGTVKALDMTWYSRYKAEADRVLSGFLWLGFVWMLFKRIPSIIKGTSMETEERSKL